MTQFKALLMKELKEAFRDRRALLAAFSMAILAPVMIFGVSKFVINKAVDKPPIYVNMSGGEFAPELVEKLKTDKILTLSDASSDQQRLWQERNIELNIPAEFMQNMLEGKTIDVVLRADYSDKAIAGLTRRIKSSVQKYAQKIGYNRLIMRGVDVALLRPINLVEQDIAQPSSNAMMISMMLGIYLLMAAFISGLSVAIDSSAGERERNVLEMLLCQPVNTLKIVLAKLACASLIAALGVVLVLSLTTFTVGFIDLTKIGATFSLNVIAVVSLLALLLPICVLASALQLFFAFQTKSFKEAQSTVSMIIVLPMLVPTMLTFMEDKPAWLNWAPLSGQYLLMEDLFKGVPVSCAALLFTGITTLAISALLVKAMAVRLRSEKVVLSLG